MRTLCISLLGFVFAAQSVAPGQGTPVSAQEQARLRFEALHESMQRLQVALSESAPEESKVLAVGNKFVQESRIRERMGGIKRLLAESRWDEALEEMAGVQEQLHSLVNLLLNRDVDLAELMKEIEKLEGFSQRVDDLIDQQKAEKEDAARTEALQEHLERMQQAAAALDQLAQQQRGLRQSANASGLSASDEDAKDMEQEEAELAEQAEALAEEMKALEEENRELTEPAEGEGDSQGESPSSAQSGSCSSACQGASKSMGKAQEKLGDNKPESSLEDMDRALRKLEEAKKALAELSEEAKRELLKLPMEQQASKQEETRVDTDKLAQEMEQNGSEGEPSAEKAPGAENVQQAVPKQKAAAGQLKEHKPSEAKQDQQDALENLEEAKQKLEDALAQLRRQLQDEVLRALEERFAAMLAAQKELSARTVATDRLSSESLTVDGSLSSALVERCRELAGGELELASEAGDALKLLEEEGTTAVFPELVEELESDLQTVGGRLAEPKTGPVTQMMQTEIEDTLETLLGALRRTIEENEGGSGECDGEPPLVPRSAELKLILALQKRVHENTVSYDTTVSEDTRVTEDAQAAAAEVARKQGRVKELTRKLAVKINKEAEEAENR